MPNPSASNPVAKSASVPGSGVGRFVSSDPSNTFPPHPPSGPIFVLAPQGDTITRNSSPAFNANVLENTCEFVDPSFPTHASVFVSANEFPLRKGFDPYPSTANASPGCTLPKFKVIEVAPSLNSALTSNPSTKSALGPSQPISFSPLPWPASPSPVSFGPSLFAKRSVAAQLESVSVLEGVAAEHSNPYAVIVAPPDV